jgi:hypothetical protein
MDVKAYVVYWTGCCACAVNCWEKNTVAMMAFIFISNFQDCCPLISSCHPRTGWFFSSSSNSRTHSFFPLSSLLHVSTFPAGNETLSTIDFGSDAGEDDLDITHAGLSFHDLQDVIHTQVCSRTMDAKYGSSVVHGVELICAGKKSGANTNTKLEARLFCYKAPFFLPTNSMTKQLDLNIRHTLALISKGATVRHGAGVDGYGAVEAGKHVATCAHGRSQRPIAVSLKEECEVACTGKVTA